MDDIIRPDFDDPSKGIDLMDMLIDARRKFTQAGGDSRNGEYFVFVPAKRLKKLQKSAKHDARARELLKLFRPIPD